MTKKKENNKFIEGDWNLPDKEAKRRIGKRVLMNYVRVYGALNRLIAEVNKKYPYRRGEMYDLNNEDCTLPSQMWLELHVDCGGTFCWPVEGFIPEEFEKEGMTLIKELIEYRENKQNK